MNVEFSADRSGTDALGFLVSKGAVGSLVLAGVAAGDAAQLRAAAHAQRFEGEAGSLAEHFMPVDGVVRRVLLAGTGAQTVVDYEKAGAALSARLITSGETCLVVDFNGAAVATEARNRFIAAVLLRGWRYDIYRTKLPEKQKASLATLRIVGAPADTAGEWAAAAAVVKGNGFTRMLVTEPANVIYPESFVAHCQQLADLGVELTVLD